MKNSTGVLIGFLLGGTLGSVVTYIFVKDKFANQAQAEIEEIREYYSNRKPADICEKPEPPMTKEEIFHHISDYDEKVFDLGYWSHHAESGSEDKIPINQDGPYVISPEEFGEIAEYSQISLTYYEGDGVLADDGDEMVNNIAETVGNDFQTHFGEYEDDSVFVRNPVKKCDYEILLDYRKYADILKLKPPED